MWTAQQWNFIKPRTFITSGGLGTMGYGLGATIGSQMGNLDKRVLLVTGDGSFRMSCNELQTSVKYKLAEAYGIEGYRVNDIVKLENLLERVRLGRKPVIIDCVIDKDEGVYPIVPPGK